MKCPNLALRMIALIAVQTLIDVRNNKKLRTNFTFCIRDNIILRRK